MRILLLLLLAALTAGCTPQGALLAAAVPDGMTSALLAQTQRVKDDNRRKVVAFEQARDWAGLARFAEDNVKRDPHTPDWWTIAGYAYTQLAQHGRAAECYAEAVRLEPDVTLYWTLLAQAYRAGGQPQRAATALNNAVLARRDDAQLHWLLGETLSDIRRWPDAIAAYRAAVGVDERHVPSWLGLERAYRAAGRTEDARTAAREIERLRDAPQPASAPAR